MGTTDGHICIEGAKDEGGLLGSGFEGNAYAEGEGEIFSGRGGTGGISAWRLSCGGTTTGPWSTTAAARGRVGLLNVRDFSPLDVKDPRRDSTPDRGVGGCV